jgi:hypothetical protein
VLVSIVLIISIVILVVAIINSRDEGRLAVLISLVIPAVFAFVIISALYITLATEPASAGEYATSLKRSTFVETTIIDRYAADVRVIDSKGVEKYVMIDDKGVPLIRPVNSSEFTPVSDNHIYHEYKRANETHREYSFIVFATKGGLIYPFTRKGWMIYVVHD